MKLISKNSKLNLRPSITCKPKDSLELVKFIKQRVDKRGWDCDLNDIDVSGIKKFIDIFATDTWFDLSNFDGDISFWDVSKGTHFTRMFRGSKFTGKNSNLKQWNLSHGKRFGGMFYESAFNSDISNWEIKEDADTHDMFTKCPIEEKYKPKGVK